METGSPAAADVLAELQRVIASRSFARAGTSAELLRYIVEKTTAGQSDGVKEYTIALEVFGRSSYDPQVDSLVRVQAGKLRKRLARYYELEGGSDPVRIDIPKGSYVPTFHSTIPDRLPPLARRKRLIAMSGIAVMALIAAGAFRLAVTPRPPSRPAGTPSLAIVPFVDLTPSKHNEQLCDGVTQELINMLAGMDGWRVASRSSVSPYKGGPVDVRRIGNELQVLAVLEGSVRLEGSRIRVIVQLIDTRDGIHLWTNTYDREAPGDSDIQREIAGAIFRDFLADVHPIRRALVQTHSRNAEARHYYFRATRLSLAEPRKAVEFYQAAVASDPDYAMAWAALAQNWLVAADWGEAKAADAYPKAAEGARRALAIDETVSEAHHADAKIKVYYKQDWRGAEKAFRRALDLDPTHVDARFDYARYVLTPNGRFSEAVDQMQRAIALNPGKNTLHNELASIHIKAREYDKALKPLEVSRGLNPTAPATWIYTGMAAAGAGDYEEALRRFEKAAERRRTHWVLSHIGWTYGKLGRTEEARKVAAELEKTPAGKPAFSYELATIYAALGERDSAFAALDRSVASLSPEMIWIKVDYRLDDLRSDPRFGRLLKKMRLE